LEHLFAEPVVLLVRVLNLANSVLDRPLDLFSFLLDVLVLAAGLSELLPEIVSLLLEKRNV
jgi:hypothetical protein